MWKLQVINQGRKTLILSILSFLRMIFDSLHSLVSHKRHYCKLRFTCKCEEEDNESTGMEKSVPSILQCSSCNQDFEDPWDLMEHVQVRGFFPFRQRFNYITAYPIFCRTCTHLRSMSCAMTMRTYQVTIFSEKLSANSRNMLH